MGIIDKARQMDPITLGEMAEKVPSADLISLIGRIRDPV
jgi:hypothetical protein